jgi:HAE1 family hydrophobic/amphiphilic exporter-1
MQSSDIDELYPAAAKFLTAMQQSPLLMEVTSDLQLSNPQVNVQIDRSRAAALGVTADAVQSTLYGAYGSRQVSTINTSNDQYWVIMEVLPQYQRDISALQQLYVPSTSGRLVPLSSIATLSRNIGPSAVNHSGQIPSVTISFNIRPGTSLGAATSAVEKLAQQNLPGGITTAFSGTAQVFQSTQAGMLVLVVLAIFVIYVILGVLYESFIHPVTILSGLPFAAFGALVTLLLFRLDLDIYGFVGIIMLIGIVEKNAIMMIDFAIEAQRDGNRTPSEAILEAASVRFRPIMMTTMAALMGAVPIAVGWGAGASTRRPLGVAVVGGLAFSQLVTLYVTPVFYTYLDEWQQGFSRRRARSQHGSAVSPPPDTSMPGGQRPEPAAT